MHIKPQRQVTLRNILPKAYNSVVVDNSPTSPLPSAEPSSLNETLTHLLSPRLYYPWVSNESFCTGRPATSWLHGAGTMADNETDRTDEPDKTDKTDKPDTKHQHRRAPEATS